MEPKGAFQAKKRPFPRRKGTFWIQKEAVWSLRGSFGAGKGHFKQTNSFSDPKRAHWRPKIALWKRKNPFQCQNSPFGDEKGSFVIKSFQSGRKGQGGPKLPLCLKRPGWRLGGAKRHVTPLPFRSFGGHDPVAPLRPPMRCTLCDSSHTNSVPAVPSATHHTRTPYPLYPL